MTPNEKLPTSLKIFHGIGSVAYGIKDSGFGTFLLLFYNQVVGLDAGLVSLALMIAMFADALADPMIGHYSDKTYTRWGKRLPWLCLAVIMEPADRIGQWHICLFNLLGDFGAGVGIYIRNSGSIVNPAIDQRL
jgi:MFS/sugar transport protein